MSIAERLMALTILASQLKESAVQDIPKVLGIFLSEVETGQFIDCLMNIDVRRDIQFKNIFELLGSELEQQCFDKKLLAYIKDSIVELGLSEDFAKVTKLKLENLSNEYHKFLNIDSYMIENYLVTTLFTTCLSVSSQTIFSGVYEIILRYSLLSTLMMG